MFSKVLSLRPVSKLWYIVPAGLLLITFGILFFNSAFLTDNESVRSFLDSDFALYLLVGLAAQLVDGALGMAYGITSTSFLLGMGISPAVSSTSVHVAEMFTTGASAISHFKFRNINKKLFKSLLIAGVAGSVTGAYLLSDVIDGNVIKPYIAFYMLVLGIVIIRKAVQKKLVKNKTRRIGILAAAGGFLDSVGGGGWGPIVTSTLLGQGRDPRYTIGSVNAAEFIITFSSGVTFLIFNGINSWQVVLGLIIGGVIAAPFGALLVGKINRKALMLSIGILVIGLSLRTILQSTGVI
ncbi:sulfite exporter TauE/SafE family protein [Dyadobacter flavalbus]|uniref:Probable membrane transporter protein n=1 Tax=Dyadobacter flavalbus TaxID=2579942 RepID=A0A5M8QQ08_9BACT|nr:sulfite exporter TauE/SafE family protein [Dyadobacter flavalbus]KAA6438255.1 sulfite exporter TauE/SafE family protein [Dyadobacter flavalbus]